MTMLAWSFRPSHDKLAVQGGYVRTVQGKAIARPSLVRRRLLATVLGEDVVRVRRPLVARLSQAFHLVVGE
jgi:hypothetical protein